MKFERDHAKSNACFEQRGFYFAYMLQVFLYLERLVREVHSWDCGEARIQIIGAINGRASVLVYKVLGTSIRIISARRANSRDIKML